MDEKLKELEKTFSIPKFVRKTPNWLVLPFISPEIVESSIKTLDDPVKIVEIQRKNEEIEKVLIIDGVRFDLLRKLSDEAKRKRGEPVHDLTEEELKEIYDLRLETPPLDPGLSLKIWDQKTNTIYEENQLDLDEFVKSAKHITIVSADDYEDRQQIRIADGNLALKLLRFSEYKPRKLSFSDC